MARPSRNSLADLIEPLARVEGRNTTRHPSIVTYRVSAKERPTPTFYPASLILIGSGRKFATLGEQVFSYNPGNYLVVASPMPMICRTLASLDEPLLSMVVELDVGIVREVLLEMYPDTAPPLEHSFQSVYNAPVTDEIENAGARLLGYLADDRRTRTLARQTIRELVYLLLEGPNGDALRALAEGPTAHLAHVLRHINQNITTHMTIAALAKLAHMSVPTFHQHFKTMTGRSPLQYIKALRLARAKELLFAGALVKNVAREVGYDSESQFSREYRRFHGAPPSALVRA